MDRCQSIPKGGISAFTILPALLMSVCVGQLLGYGVQTFHNAFALLSLGGAIPIV